jgi:hypothetical protein
MTPDLAATQAMQTSRAECFGVIEQKIGPTSLAHDCDQAKAREVAGVAGSTSAHVYGHTLPQFRPRLAPVLVGWDDGCVRCSRLVFLATRRGLDTTTPITTTPLRPPIARTHRTGATHAV